MWDRISPWDRQKYKRHRKSRFQIETQLVCKAQLLQIFFFKKVRAFVEAAKIRVMLVFLIQVPVSGVNVPHPMSNWYYIFLWVWLGWVPPPPPDEPGHRGSPEMNELESDKQILKIWAYNFEKQKIEHYKVRQGFRQRCTAGMNLSFNLCERR